MGFFDKLFGTYSDRELKRINPIADKIEAMADAMAALSDEQLRAKTDEFKKRYNDGESLDALLPEAGALVAAVRVATGVEPVVIGKPSPTLFQEALRAAGCNPGDALAVGDCLDTDIAAATAAGIPSCLLLTGVTTRDDADRSPLRPTVVCDNWAGLRQCLSLRKEP